MKIGDVTVVKRMTDFKLTPDDRQTMIQTMNSNIVEDYGHVDSGDRVSAEFTLTDAGWATIKNYWINRTKIDIVDEGGRIYTSRRILVKGYQPIIHFAGYWRVELEFWNI